MKIGFGSDHAAIELKNCLLEHLKARGFDCVDFGAVSPQEELDYPVPGRKVSGFSPRTSQNAGWGRCS